MPQRVTHRLRLAVLVVALLSAFVFANPPAAAQTDPGDCYPDGCETTTTTTDPGLPDPTCELSLRAGPVGAEVVATVRDVPLGLAVRILVDGVEMASGANDDGQAVDDVVMTFDVPDLEPGSYSIVAVGTGFTITCGVGGLDVLGSGASLGPGSAQAGGSGGGGSGAVAGDDGALAFTGAEIAGLVSLALALLAVGAYLVRRTRQNRLA